MEEIAIGDNNLIPLNTSNSKYTLSNTLYIPYIKQNLICVSKYCQNNLTSYEFLCFHFFFERSYYGSSIGV